MAEQVQLIFGLPPIFGLLPLLVYVVLSFKEDLHPIFNVLVCVLLGAIMVKQPLLGLGSVIAGSLGSFLALIGFIIMLGAGLGNILKKTGVANNIVNFLARKIGVNTPTRAIIATMVCSVALVTLLGTLAGANAIIAPIIIPLVATIGLTPATLAVVFQGAGQTGLFLGPFTPPMVTLMGITGLSYPQLLMYAGIPISAVMWVGTYFVAKHVQKCTQGKESFGIGGAAEEYVATEQAKRATIIFLATILALVAYGIYKKGGASYSIVVMGTAGILTGFAGGLKIGEIFDALTEGFGRLVWLFVMFILFDPFLVFVENSGAFEALVGYLEPTIASVGKVGFGLLTAIIGVFGVNGAAVAQALMLDKLFNQFLPGLGISPGLWAMIVLIGSQITSFAYPGADMLGQMGLANAKDVKQQMKLSYYAIVPGTLLLVVVASLIL